MPRTGPQRSAADRAQRRAAHREDNVTRRLRDALAADPVQEQAP
jgi:hypothetical protein